jgi:hypothetical protein
LEDQLRRILIPFSIFAIAITNFCGSAKAEDEIPTYRVLTCEKDCPVFQSAVPVNIATARYPGKFTGSESRSRKLGFSLKDMGSSNV